MNPDETLFAAIAFAVTGAFFCFCFYFEWTAPISILSMNDWFESVSHEAALALAKWTGLGCLVVSGLLFSLILLKMLLAGFGL